MSKVESSFVISNRRRTVGLAHARTIEPRTRVTRRSPLSRTLRPVESMNSTPVRSRITPVLPPAIAAFSRSENSGAVVAWISPATRMTTDSSSSASSVKSKFGASNAISTDTNGPARPQGALQRETLVGIVEYPAESLAQSRQSVTHGLRVDMQRGGDRGVVALRVEPCGERFGQLS